VIPPRATVAWSASRADGSLPLEDIVKKRFLSTGTLVRVACIAAAIALTPLASAVASPPVHTVDDLDFVIDDMCAFPVDI
jgi:hypothetical protein